LNATKKNKNKNFNTIIINHTLRKSNRSFKTMYD
jgi:hypothetical protein